MNVPDDYIRQMARAHDRLRHHCRVLSNKHPDTRNTYELSHVLRDIHDLGDLIATLHNHSARPSIADNLLVDWLDPNCKVWDEKDEY